MKNRLALMVCLIISTSLFSQSLDDFAVEGEFLALINDPDGYTNVREAPSTQGKIIAKIYKGELFQVYQEAEEGPGWYEISFEKEGKNQLGFIHKSRVCFVESLPQLKLKGVTTNLVTFAGDNKEVTINSGPFDPSRYKVNRAEQGWVKDINGKKVWGTDGGLPGREIRTIIFKIDGRDTFLPEEAFQDTFEPNLTYAKVYVSPDGLIFLWMSNSDGAGGYDVIWVVKDGKYLKRYIGHGA